ncbi:MAG: elongation factor G [Planctomycetota bacterium]|jgi:elongation factor G|nr:elongation factor G [Planctomycetota bacterium]MDA1202297.1 elongation factor G [Planctomycetota bacterium]
MDLTKLRNMGISAHIDSGKTTLSERILFYAGRIHRIQEVKGDGDGATMDYMDLERERGITITSAATSVTWGDCAINLIDTPGHVDFTVEVERSLRVLDGAILVLCSVGGVQSQSMTVDRQMQRYKIPRLAFVNKMDRTGANFERVVGQLKDKLGCHAIPMQIPIGKEDKLEGVIDLVRMKGLYFDGSNGETVREEEIPAELQEAAAAARHTMLEDLAMYSDSLMEKLLSEEVPTEDEIHEVVKSAVQSQSITPVFCGSAYKNKGVQPLLDAVVRYLPNPLERKVFAKKWDNPDETFELEPDPAKPFVGMAFKIVDDPYGQLTFMRLYQGTAAKGETYINQRTSQKQRFSRIVRMHADKREEVDTAEAGDIVAMMGVDAASGDTYASEAKYCSLENMFVPEPVIKMAITPTKREGLDKLGKALQRFTREDPTFRVATDDETGETVIAGMGELHLDIYVERIRREFKVDVEVGAPKVSYREAPTRSTKYDYKHKKQTGGSGQYAHIIGELEPLPEDAEDNFIFEDKVVGGRVPREYIPSVEKGFRAVLDKGPIAGFPIVQVKAVLADGSYHDVDSSDMAFQTCARAGFREAFLATKPVLLEPIMKMEVEVPSDFQGPVTGELNKRRGLIVSTETVGNTSTIIAEVPLAETFGYSTDLRSMTQGQGVFTMEFAKYRPTPGNIQKEIVEERKKQELAAAK